MGLLGDKPGFFERFWRGLKAVAEGTGTDPVKVFVGAHEGWQQGKINLWKAPARPVIRYARQVGQIIDKAASDDKSGAAVDMLKIGYEGYKHTQPGLQISDPFKRLEPPDMRLVDALSGDVEAADSLSEDFADAACQAAGARWLLGPVKLPTVRVYRGVNESHVGYENALNGVVKANKQWWQFWKRGATPLEHNRVRGATKESQYTSWTLNEAVAENYAVRPSGPGVVITAEIVESRLTISPNTKDVLLKGTNTTVSEAEVLIQGTVRGTVRKVGE